MNRGPQSWTASILGFALVVLAVCAAFNLAAQLLREALPVLIPAGVVAIVSIGLWQWRSRSRGW